MESLTDVALSTVKSIDKKNFIDVTRIILEIVEQEPHLKGDKAKSVAIVLVKAMVDAYAGDDKEWLHSVIDSGVLESTVDALIAASKGLYSLNKRRKISMVLGNCAKCIGN